MCISNGGRRNVRSVLSCEEGAEEESSFVPQAQNYSGALLKGHTTERTKKASFQILYLQIMFICKGAYIKVGKGWLMLILSHVLCHTCEGQCYNH